MVMDSLRVFVFTLLLVLPVAFAALPKGWKACSKSNKNYEKCLKNEVNHAFSTLINGDKQLGLQPIDPLRITKLEIPKHDGPVSIALSFNEIDVIGIKDIKIDSIKNDWKTLTGAGKIPRLRVIGKYKVDGKVLVLPITGDGPCNLTLEEVNLKASVKWKKIDKDGKKYFQMEKLVIDLEPKKLIIHLENLFNGNKALGDNMNVFLNENWDKILAELKPAITDALSQVLVNISNRVLAKIPANEIDIK